MNQAQYVIEERIVECVERWLSANPAAFAHAVMRLLAEPAFEERVLGIISAERNVVRAALADQIPMPRRPAPAEAGPSAEEQGARRAEEERVAAEMNSTGILTPWHLYR